MIEKPLLRQQVSAPPQPILMEVRPDLEQVESKPTGIHHIRLMAEQLDTPANSLPFLELYHKSAQKVEEAAGTLRKVSVCFGAIACFLFLVSGFSLLYHSGQVQRSDVLQAKHRLQQASNGYVDFNNLQETERFVEETLKQ